VKGGLLLDIVIGQSSTVFELLSRKNQSLLIGWNALLVLNFRLDILDSIGWLGFKGNSLASKCFNKNLHTTSESEYQVKGGLLLNIVIGQSSTVFQLLSSEDQSLLIRWNSLFVLNLRFNVFDGVGRFDFERDGFTG